MIKEKNKQDLDVWLHEGLVDSSVYWKQTFGVPFGVFNDWVKTKLPTKGHQIVFVGNFYKKYFPKHKSLLKNYVK